jgi:type 1 glutamine amidotransferase/nicotinamidase-related amidase
MHKQERRTAVTRTFSMVLLAMLAAGAGPSRHAAAGAETLMVEARRRVAVAHQPGEFEIVNVQQTWEASQTSVIVCDMWDRHWCKGATRRVGELVPAMNEFIIQARNAGALIIHAPSDTVGYYANHPARIRARQAPRAANLPDDIGSWRSWLDEDEKRAYPMDQSDGGCDCKPRCAGGSPWRKQIEGLEIRAEDAISDSGVEIWNLMEERGARNVLVMGVHTNMCVLGRPFGLRNLARYGKNVVLVRDLTDTMYNPRMPPNVDHFTGTDLIVEHIEKYICPTAASTSLTGKPRFRFSEDKRPTIAFMIAENEYGSGWTIPAFAGRLQRQCGVFCDFLIGLRDGPPAERDTISNMVALETADLAVVYVRRRALPEAQMKYLRGYLEGGKPLVGIRTASHAFDTKGSKSPGCTEWTAFDPEVLGGNYNGHYGKNEGATNVSILDGARNHPVLQGVSDFQSPGWLYRVRPLAAATQVLMMGQVTTRDPEPVAWTHTYKGGRIFYTSLGHWDDWKITDFNRLMTNAVFWAMGTEVPGGSPEDH